MRTIQMVNDEVRAIHTHIHIHNQLYSLSLLGNSTRLKLIKIN